MTNIASPKSANIQPTSEASIAHITSSRVLALNSAWNIFGRLAPMIVAVLLTPHLFRAFGASRWGVFTVALTITGMMGMFDFGLGRALSRSVAVNIGNPGKDSAAEVKTGLIALTICGAVGAFVFLFIVDAWARDALKVPPSLENEVRTSLRLVCLCVPVMILNSTLSSILASYQQQRILALIGIPTMVLFYVCPLVAFHWFPTLISVILCIFILRATTTYVYWKLCCRMMPGLRHAIPEWNYIKPLVRIGGWMAISGMLAPLFLYLDRFVIATYLSAAITGYYVTSGDLVSKFQSIPIAVAATSFPAFAASYQYHHKKTADIYRRSTLLVLTLLLMPTILITLFNYQILELWMGKDFAVHAAPVLRWFGIGLIAAFADSSGLLIDALGYPRVNAIWCLIEIGMFVPLVFFGIKMFGIEGAAAAWAIKSLVNFVSKTTIMVRLFPPVKPAAFRILGLVVCGTVALALAPHSQSPVLQLAFASVFFISYISAVWFGCITRTERVMIAAKATLLTTLQRDEGSPC